MATWSNNNRACSTLWTTLFSMQQLTTNFDDSGELKMSDLTYFTALGASSLDIQAKAIANQLDNVFRNARGAVYEKDVTATSAISNMVEILVDSSKSVSDLAEVADSAYKFWGQ